MKVEEKKEVGGREVTHRSEMQHKSVITNIFHNSSLPKFTVLRQVGEHLAGVSTGKYHVSIRKTLQDTVIQRNTRKSRKCL